ncbi:hypothetical protein QBC46DRAFT_355388 [Diplogelasinospora grovesii]|uniref:Heterokaryon incompatibility domain-containing protein n=1 Tax=Diplogelasinospora grovesii TaxID=303347 RepID=A0AAN6N4I1_9PEZI|nr:hypothetical protein QBC46DRAFT_355388 [Diplogelasinospora grovesii]
MLFPWGRWRIKGQDADTAPALPVKNTPWPIPPVSSDHFTVEAFKTVIDQIAKSSGVSWVWVDVGCIDQRRDDPKSGFINTQAPIEIGRQAAVFKRAKSTFVWLCRLSNAKLTAAVADVQQHGLDFSDYILGPNRGQRIPDPLAESLRKAFDDIFSDPWFSSLWTLQEVVLRNDALVFSTDGTPVLWAEGQRMFLTMFINHCQNVYRDLEKALAQKQTSSSSSSWVVSEAAASAIHRIKQQILQAGFYYLFSTNPNVQYGTARYRTTTRPEDRIYAIMQIYNIVVGKSVRPDENPQLDELVPEFAAAINNASAILGQYFVHTQKPGSGASWQITEQSIIPDALMVYRDPVNLATITLATLDFDGGENGQGQAVAVAKGMVCSFPDLLKASQEDGRRNPSFARQGLGLDFEAFLDHHVPGRDTFQYPLGGPGGIIVDYEKKVQVLHLGHLRGLPKKPPSGEFHRRHVGLLLHSRTGREGAKGQESVAFERLGVCIWSDRSSNDLLEKIEWRGVERMVLE